MLKNFPPAGNRYVFRIHKPHLLDLSKAKRILPKFPTLSFPQIRFNSSLLSLLGLDLPRNLLHSLPLNFSVSFLPLLLAFFTFLHDELLKQVKTFSA